jgi:hypothetical protein
MAIAIDVCGQAWGDEGGISFWLPGQSGSFAAAPQAPGWSLGTLYYHTTANATGAVAAAREVQIGAAPATASFNLNLSLNGTADLVFLSPAYTFATPVLGGQLSMTMTGIFGRNSTNLAGTLTAAVGPIVATRVGVLDDTLTSYGDIYPTATLRWHDGVNNYMAYVSGDIPAGDYDSSRLANIGVGHGAVDVGGGYTYLNPATGNEFSAVLGVTYNFKNAATQYQSGVDLHFDWGASHFLTKQVFIGAVGYAYQQITDDFGQPALLGGFRSRVLGIGPQLGYLFPLGNMNAFLGLKGYYEFEAANRASGWNTWLTFSISESAPTPAPAIKRLTTK